MLRAAARLIRCPVRASVPGPSSALAVAVVRWLETSTSSSNPASVATVVAAASTGIEKRAKLCAPIAATAATGLPDEGPPGARNPPTTVTGPVAVRVWQENRF